MSKPAPRLRDDEDTFWEVETSHLIRVPDGIISPSVDWLQGYIQCMADLAEGSLPFGELHFRFELDRYNEVEVVHASFINRHGKPQRFMRLRRVEQK